MYYFLLKKSLGKVLTNNNNNKKKFYGHTSFAWVGINTYNCVQACTHPRTHARISYINIITVVIIPIRSNYHYYHYLCICIPPVIYLLLLMYIASLVIQHSNQ